MTPFKTIPPTILWNLILKWCWFGLVISITFRFSCCMLIDKPTFCIAKIQVSTATSFFIISTHFNLTFFIHVLPFKWLHKELKGMLHNLLAFLNVVLLLSIASIVFSSASSIHFPSHSLIRFYKHSEAYVWGLTLVGCFLCCCLIVCLVPLHFVFCKAYATSWTPLPSWS